MKPIKVNRMYSYTKKEIEIMKKYYQKEGIHIEKRLPGRTRDSIRKTATRLGLFSPYEYTEARWSTYEEKILLDNINDGISAVMQCMPWRSKNSIYNKAYRMGILEMEHWSEEEVEVLRINYGKTDDWKNLLPKRSISSISKKAFRLGLSGIHNWTDNDIDTLVRFFPLEYYDVCMRLNRSYHSVHDRVLGLIRNSNVKWSTVELKDLKDKINYYGVDALTMMEGKTFFDCIKAANDLEIMIKFWSTEEDKKIIRRGLDANLPGRTQDQIYWRMKNLGKNALNVKHITEKQKNIIRTKFVELKYNILFEIPDLRYYRILMFANKNGIYLDRYSDAELYEGIKIVSGRVNTNYE